ncbi:MAG: PAC2 family protein, partial [Acidimicrobiales bacterium]
FFDFQQQRPNVRIEDGKRIIDWPDTRCYALRSGDDRDILTIEGVEPHLRWRTFAEQIVEIGKATGAELFVTLGAAPGMVPHTRPIEVVGSATDAELALRLGLGRPSYEGPSGVMGVIHDALDASGLPVISLRVSVPHYVMGEPSPKATQSLLRRLESVTGVPTESDGLDELVTSWQEMVDSAVVGDPEVLAYVSELESNFDESGNLDLTGVDLAAEVEAFLRERNPDD